MNQLKNFKKDLVRLLVVCLAAVLMALNIKSFVRTGGLYPGGATGLTLLLQRVFELWFHIELPYTVVNVLLNAFPVYLGFRFIGKKFTLYSVLMIMLTMGNSISSANTAARTPTTTRRGSTFFVEFF